MGGAMVGQEEVYLLPGRANSWRQGQGEGARSACHVVGPTCPCKMQGRRSARARECVQGVMRRRQVSPAPSHATLFEGPCPPCTNTLPPPLSLTRAGSTAKQTAGLSLFTFPIPLHERVQCCGISARGFGALHTAGSRQFCTWCNTPALNARAHRFSRPAQSAQSGARSLPWSAGRSS